MGTNNVIGIDIVTTDKAGLAKLTTDYQTAGRKLGEAISKPLDAAERKTRENTTKMSGSMKGAVSQMTRELDKLERSAALSGEGMSEGYASALAKVRGDLELVSRSAARTGQGLDSNLGGALRSVKRSMDELKPAAANVDKGFDTAAKSIERDLQRIERQAWETGNGLDKSMTRALTDTRAELARVKSEAARTGAGLESDLGGALHKVSQQAAKMGSALHEGMSSGASAGGGAGGGMLSSLLGDFASVKGGALAAGAAVGGLLWSGLQSEWGEDRVGALISAQTGAAMGSGERLGNMTGDIFAASFGDSLDQVGEAMTAVFQNKLIDTSAPDAAIEHLTEKVLTLQQVTGESADSIARSAQKLLITGMAGNMTAALDMIQTAVEHGLNTTGELFDTITEYSTMFRALGLNGQEAFGLIGQAIEGGARNVDIAADALKEFDIRAQDGSVATRRGFTAIGLDAKRMGEMIAQGGAPAKQALRETLNALQAMKPGIERNSAAVDLFGTKAEDLGSALYDMDLDNASQKFGDFGGAVEKASQKISSGQSTWDKFTKGLGVIAGGIGQGIDDLFQMDDGGILPERTKKITALNLAMEQLRSSGDTTWMDEYKKKYPESTDLINKMIAATKSQADANHATASGFTELTETMDAYLTKQKDITDATAGLHNSQIGYNKALTDAQTTVDTFGAKARDLGEGLMETRDGFNLSSEAGQTMQEKLDNIATSAMQMADDMDTNGASVFDVNKHMADARDRFIATAEAMGVNTDAARRMADQLGLIPKKVNTLVELRSAVAESAARRLLDLIRNMPATKLINLRVNTTGLPGGHFYAGQASGGITGQRPMTAASGGARNGSTLVNEAGPELIELPSGSQVMTAGATRAMGEAGMLGGGGGGVVVELSWGGNPDDLASAVMKGLRAKIKNEHGGSVANALNQRGVT